jgi:hypothetical protein
MYCLLTSRWGRCLRSDSIMSFVAAALQLALFADLRLGSGRPWSGGEFVHDPARASSGRLAAPRIGISPPVAAGGSAVIRDWAHYQLINFGQVVDVAFACSRTASPVRRPPTVNSFAGTSFSAVVTGRARWTRRLFGRPHHERRQQSPGSDPILRPFATGRNGCSRWCADHSKPADRAKVRLNAGPKFTRPRPKWP